MLSHAEHLELPRDTPLKRTLFACDELSGFVHACGLVRPTGLDGLEPKSVRKKLKQPSFAAGRPSRRGLRGRRAARPRARRAHHQRDRGAAADRARARAPHRRRRGVNPEVSDFKSDTGALQSNAGDEPIEILVARPPAARDADEAATRDVADVDALRVQPSDESGRVVLRCGRRRASRPPRARRARPERPGAHGSASQRRQHARATTPVGARAP